MVVLSPVVDVPIVIDTFAGELGRLNNGNVITPDFEYKWNRAMPGTILFSLALSWLSNILRRDESDLSDSSASCRSNEFGRALAMFALDFVHHTFDVLELDKVAWYRGSQYVIRAE